MTKTMHPYSPIAATFGALMLISAGNAGCLFDGDETSDETADDGGGGAGATGETGGSGGGAGEGGGEGGGGEGGGEVVPGDCSGDDICNPDCAATMDPDCLSPEPAGSDVIPPDELPCSNVGVLPPGFMNDGPGETTLGTNGADCIVYDEVDSIFVDSGETLTIEAGVTLKFKANEMLRVQWAGSLQVMGTQTHPVVFTGSEQVRGHWEGILFDSTIDFDTYENKAVESRLEYAIVEYGGAALPGSFDGAISVRRARLSIVHSLIRESGTSALELEEYGFLSELDANTFTANAGAAVWTYPQGIGQLTSNNNYRGNDVDQVEIYGESGEVVTEPTTWSRLNVPYHLSGEVLSQTMLTIEAGTRFVAAEGAHLVLWSMDGGLIAEGTSTLPIVLEGEQHTPGFWRGVRIENSDQDNVLRYVAIKDGGSSPVAGRANLTLRSDLSQVRPHAEVSHCLFQDSAQWGVEIQNATVPDGLLENNTLINNAAGDVNVFNN